MKLLGTSGKAIVQLVVKQRLVGRLMPQKGGPPRVLVQRKSVDKLLARRSQLVSVSQAAVTLGLHTPVTEVLLEHGIVVADRCPSVDGHSNWLVHPTELDYFMKKVASCANPMKLPDEPRLTRITEVITTENVLNCGRSQK